MLRLPNNESPAETPQMDELKHIASSVVIALGTVWTWLTGVLPPFAAALTIGWVAYQWWHHPKMAEWRAGRKARKISRSRK